MSKLLKNRAFAWFLALVIMILSVAAGAYTSYASMRNTAVAAFEREMMPLVNQAMIHAHDMQSVSQNYLSAAEISVFGIGRHVAEIQATNDPTRIFEHYVLINRAVWDMHELLIETGDFPAMSDTNRRFIINFHADFNQIDLILFQAGYNNIAEDFNNALGSGLGFLVRPFISEMPRFDVIEEEIP